jgi:hypothetical protein
MYVVYQDGKRCSEYGIAGWENDAFATKRQAEIYAFHWAYPFTREEAEVGAPTMEVGREYDYSTCEIPVMMKIEFV